MRITKIYLVIAVCQEMFLLNHYNKHIRLVPVLTDPTDKITQAERIK